MTTIYYSLQLVNRLNKQSERRMDTYGTH